MNGIIRTVWLMQAVTWPWTSLAAEEKETRESIYLRMDALANASLDLAYDLGTGEDRIRYRLFLPEPYEPGVSYPLIIWLHGWGDRGDDNRSHLRHMDATICRQSARKVHPFFVLAPQCSMTPSRNWLTPLRERSSDHSSANRDMLSATVEILDHIQQEYTVDKRRVILVGVSSGGSACWELLRREPHRFAAAATLGDGGLTSNSKAATIKTPVWAFHAAGDPEMSADGALRTIAAIQGVGGNAHLTQTKDDRHDCWTKAFCDHDLLYWLLAQRLDDPSSPLPGQYRASVRFALWWDENWPRLLLLGVVSVLCIVCYRHLKHHYTMRSKELFTAERFDNLIDSAADCEMCRQPVRPNLG